MSVSTDSRSERASRTPASLDAAIGDIDWTTPPPGSVRSRFSAPSGELSVISIGDPGHPRVVLVPGATGSKEDFALILPLLAEAGYLVQSFDLAGQYESHAAGANSAYTYELFIGDLVAFLEAGTPAHLWGIRSPARLLSWSPSTAGTSCSPSRCSPHLRGPATCSRA